MITVFGEGRGFRVVWLLEEMGLPYRLRPVDLLAGVEKDAEYLAINPAGFIPAIQDGDVTMVESIAIMEYLMARYGPTPLAPDPHDPAFPAYQQFLHLGEAGLAASMYFVVVSRHLAPEAERRNWGASKALEVFESRLGLVTRQLARSRYLRRRDVHGSRHFGELRSCVRPTRWRHRPRGGGASLYSPHQRTRSLQEGHGNMSGHEGMVDRRGARSMIALAAAYQLVGGLPVKTAN